MEHLAVFTALEWVIMVHGAVGSAFSVGATWAATEDYVYSRHERVRRVALKNLVGQITKAIALVIMAFIGLVGVLLPPTASQLLPSVQTWLFYVGCSIATTALAIGSAYSYMLYLSLIGSAGGDGNG